MSASMPTLSFQEVVEAEGHLIDSHIMERIFDTVVEYNGRFEVEDFHIGRTNSDPSKLRLKIEASSPEVMDKMLSQLLGLGCSPADVGDAELEGLGAGGSGTGLEAGLPESGSAM
jgi:hypothetical protein